MGISSSKLFILNKSNLFVPLSVHCGKEFTAISTMGGFLYIYKNSLSSPISISELNSFHITKICGNEDYLVILCEGGSIFIWGDDYFIRLPMSENYSFDNISCSMNCIIGICTDEKIMCQWTGDKPENYCAKCIKYRQNMRIFSGYKICIVTETKFESNLKIIHSSNPLKISDYSKEIIEKIKDLKKNTPKYTLLFNSMEFNEMKYENIDNESLKNKIFEVLQGLLKKIYNVSFISIKNYSFDKLIYAKSVAFARIYSILIKFQGKKVTNQLKNALLSWKNYSNYELNPKLKEKLALTKFQNILISKWNQYKRDSLTFLIELNKNKTKNVDILWYFLSLLLDN